MAIFSLVASENKKAAVADLNSQYWKDLEGAGTAFAQVIRGEVGYQAFGAAVTQARATRHRAWATVLQTDLEWLGAAVFTALTGDPAPDSVSRSADNEAAPAQDAEGDGAAAAAASVRAATPPPADGGGAAARSPSPPAAAVSAAPAASEAGPAEAPSQLPPLTDDQLLALRALLNCLATDMPLKKEVFTQKVEGISALLTGSHPLQRILVTARDHLGLVQKIMNRTGFFAGIPAGYLAASTKALESWSQVTPVEQQAREIALLCGELKKAGFEILDEEMHAILVGDWKLVHEVDKKDWRGRVVGKEMKPIYPQATNRGATLWLYMMDKAPKS